MMRRIKAFLSSCFRRGAGSFSGDVESLRNDFRARYHQFKLLLSANNQALDTMAEMEGALRGSAPFGMHFVRSRCIAVSTSVFKITKHINELSQDKYAVLFDRFKTIQKQLNPFLQTGVHLWEGEWTLPLEAVDRNLADQVGGKIANLGEVRNRLNIRVPNGFAITAAAYQRFMAHSELQPEIDRRIQATDVERLDQLYALSASIQQLIIQAPMPPELEEALTAAYRALQEKENPGVTVAMRSSALGEDLEGVSFAGQYRSQLNVSRENLFDAYREIVASKYGLTAMAYRLNRGIRDEDVAMCVACMAMVDAVAGGVTYSRNPVDIRDDAVMIHAVWGLPKSVVDGSTPTDLFVVGREDPPVIHHRDVSRKREKFVCYPAEGVCRLDGLDEEADKPSLTDEQAIELALLARRLEAYYGVAQDIEWAVDGEGRLVILQCRPLEQRTEPGPQDAARVVGAADGVRGIASGGVTASPGVGVGPVFKVRKDMDTLRFPEGAVLVASQSLPRWATLLSRAAAVVTEQGGIAGHLANVAREFGVPALFGLEGVMDSLEEGRIVTVDAEGRTLYDGRAEALLGRAPVCRRNLMEGSPVYKALQGAAALIVPLNLLDPDSMDFKPENCRTFHDITRFCHEKAVAEMFLFGKEHDFPERSSKQLVCEVPMQWWVLNLDDGFREEVQGRRVALENIVSIPMRAIWEGIRFKPWAGPPPVDGRGMLSVMFQATTNTDLVTGVRSRYAERNYFMISRNYCSLTSRLGFHFSTAEALVSDRPSENYASFHFKGGAADDERRQRRILFIADILENQGFRVEVKEDMLIARIEDRARDEMEENLKALGYLTIHTRQLDMIMKDGASVSRYRSKILHDLEVLRRLHREAGMEKQERLKREAG